jgi:cysteinyl-tRNA synthetase
MEKNIVPGEKIFMEIGNFMGNIRLYNTETRRCETIVPSQSDGILRIYCCGPTVYDHSHIGNFRTFLVQDVFRRLLIAMGYRVCFVRNITDVDDKTIRGARREKISLRQFTTQWVDIFHSDCQALHILPPDVEPRATEHIGEQITMIENLIRRGHAYVTGEGSVYFRLSSFPQYGRLSGVDPQKLLTQEENSGGAINLADEYDRDAVHDFALWKAYKEEDGDIFWESPWGKGRPGWHIECSAMATKYLGETIDVHGGGIDLCFPHHENEIAQTECLTAKPFVKHWFHGEHLRVEGQKMSKSLGNWFTLGDLKGKGYGMDTIRYALLNGHYRQPLNFTLSGLDAAQSALHKLRAKIDHLLGSKNDFRFPFGENFPPKNRDYRYFATAVEALKNDLNIPKCLGELFTILNSLGDVDEGFGEELVSLAYILGLDAFLFGEEEKQSTVSIPEDIGALAVQRWEARQIRNFEEADRLRRLLIERGWNVMDRRDGYFLEKI